MNRATNNDVQTSNQCLQIDQRIWYTLPIEAISWRVVRKMQIKRRSMPTLEGVTREMQAFEFHYRITTDQFLREEFSESIVNEDDAMQWHYLREQLSALQEAAVERLYSAFPTGSSARLKNCENSSELLAA
jgi:hypothetical protein